MYHFKISNVFLFGKKLKLFLRLSVECTGQLSLKLMFEVDMLFTDDNFSLAPFHFTQFKCYIFPRKYPRHSESVGAVSIPRTGPQVSQSPDKGVSTPGYLYSSFGPVWRLPVRLI